MGGNQNECQKNLHFLSTKYVCFDCMPQIIAWKIKKMYTCKQSLMLVEKMQVQSSCYKYRIHHLSCIPISLYNYYIFQMRLKMICQISTVKRNKKKTILYNFHFLTVFLFTQLIYTNMDKGISMFLHGSALTVRPL